MKNKIPGVVISDKMDKTRIVRVDWIGHHPVYGKVVKKRTKFFAHDAANVTHVGDKVIMTESKPLSKNKKWVIVKAAK
ncbi:MAG: 30S ribosomal protein S17 [Elusimicrobia bacterium ADurb.Bin231]|nr:MAG: 30S ribosomal protein S17 [Elusimicrobia bacterium ADurb.Bin231]